MTTWKARADAVGAKPDEARVPNNWFDDASAARKPYVRLTVGQVRIVLKIVASGVPESDQLLVTPGTFDLKDQDDIEVTAEPLSSSDYRRDWLTHTAPGKLTIVGLVIVLVGQAIQISMDIGTHWMVFDVGSGGIALLNVAKDVMTIGGAALAASQIVFNS
jgi:hypothetical protein